MVTSLSHVATLLLQPSPIPSPGALFAALVSLRHVRAPQSRTSPCCRRPILGAPFLSPLKLEPAVERTSIRRPQDLPWELSSVGVGLVSTASKARLGVDCRCAVPPAGRPSFQLALGILGRRSPILTILGFNRVRLAPSDPGQGAVLIGYPGGKAREPFAPQTLGPRPSSQPFQGSRGQSCAPGQCSPEAGPGFYGKGRPLVNGFSG